MQTHIPGTTHTNPPWDWVGLGCVQPEISALCTPRLFRGLGLVFERVLVAWGAPCWEGSCHSIPVLLLTSFAYYLLDYCTQILEKTQICQSFFKTTSKKKIPWWGGKIMCMVLRFGKRYLRDFTKLQRSVLLHCTWTTKEAREHRVSFLFLGLP